MTEQGRCGENMNRTARAKNVFVAALLVIAAAFAFSPGHCAAQQNDLGAKTPAEALDYMKMTSALFILDVSEARSFRDVHFIGSYNVPFRELVSHIDIIPEGRPVLVLCRRGRTCLKAYELIKRMRPDIPEISYIYGEPLFEEYNAWKKSN
jgi:rhodanese-related sulfurtransferase